jgi:hypothetical protein
LFLQRRQCRADLSDRRFLRRNVGSADLAQGLLTPERLELATGQRDQVMRGSDLRTKRCHLNGGHHDIARQCQVGRLQLEPLSIRQRLQRFDLPAIAAEHVGRIADAQLRRVQAVEIGVIGERAREHRRDRLPRRVGLSVDAREERALLRQDVFAGAAQRRLRGLDIGVRRQGLGDQRRDDRGRPGVGNLAGHCSLIRWAD